MTRRVAVTGIGIVTPHGLGKEVNWRKAVAGEPGIGPIRLFDASGYRTRCAGEIRELPVPPWRRARAARLDRASHILYHAFVEALDESGLSAAELAAAAPATAFGTTLGGMISGERYHAEVVRKGSGRARVSLLSDHLAHCQSLRLAEEFGIPGVPRIFSNACASGANAIGHAFHEVRRGAAEIAVCGGYDPLSEFVFAGFHSLQALTTELCRPFDRNRSGLALGEGAGVLILESWERARARGARIAGEVVGYGESTDAFHMTRPEPQGRGAEDAMRRALADAGADAGRVGYINAHGTGTPFNDATESAAIRAVFGPAAADVPVSSTKAMIGHLLGGAGAVEGILALLALREKRIPPNIHWETPDPACPLRIVRETLAADGIEIAMSNSFGFGGSNATLLFRAPGSAA